MKENDFNSLLIDKYGHREAMSIKEALYNLARAIAKEGGGISYFDDSHYEEKLQELLYKELRN